MVRMENNDAHMYISSSSTRRKREEGKEGSKVDQIETQQEETTGANTAGVVISTK